jgi:hypothetical protein
MTCRPGQGRLEGNDPDDGEVGTADGGKEFEMPLFKDRSGRPGQLLAEGIELSARQPGVVFSSHHWPTWGTGEVITYLAAQDERSSC